MFVVDDNTWKKIKKIGYVISQVYILDIQIIMCYKLYITISSRIKIHGISHGLVLFAIYTYMHISNEIGPSFVKSKQLNITNIY